MVNILSRNRGLLRQTDPDDGVSFPARAIGRRRRGEGVRARDGTLLARLEETSRLLSKQHISSAPY